MALGSNLRNWQQRLAEEKQLQDFRAAVEARMTAGPNGDLGTGEELPIQQLITQGGIGGQAQPVPGQPTQPATSGANKLYGGGAIDYAAVLDQVQGKSGLGRSALQSKIRF